MESWLLLVSCFSLSGAIPSSFHTQDQDWINFCLRSNKADCAANLVKKCSLEGDLCVPSTANIMQVPESLAPVTHDRYGTEWTRYCKNQETPEACSAAKKCALHGDVCVPSWSAVKQANIDKDKASRQTDKIENEVSWKSYCKNHQDAVSCYATHKCTMDGPLCVPSNGMLGGLASQIGSMNEPSEKSAKQRTPDKQDTPDNLVSEKAIKQETSEKVSVQPGLEKSAKQDAPIKPSKQDAPARDGRGQQLDETEAKWAQYCKKQENSTMCNATSKCEMKGGVCIPFFNAIEWPNFCKQQTATSCNATKKCIMDGSTCVPSTAQNFSRESADQSLEGDMQWTLYCNRQETVQACNATSKCEMQGNVCVPSWIPDVLKAGDRSKCEGCLARGLAFCQTDNRCQTPFERGCKSPKDHVASSQEEVDWMLKTFGHIITFPCPGSKVDKYIEPDPDSWN